MTPTPETHYPVSSLYADGDGQVTRYGYKKTLVFQALKDLAIERQIGEDKVTAYISFDDLSVLDEYVDIRKAKGKKAAEAFAKQHRGEAVELPSAIAPSAPQADYSAIVKLPPAAMLLVDAIASQLSPAADPLAPQRQLKEAYAEGWVLSTSQVREILGVKSWNGRDRFGFKFVRTGKVGTQSGWQVEKV